MRPVGVLPASALPGVPGPRPGAGGSQRRGHLYSFTVTRIPTLPDFADEMPQMLAVVELDQGVHEHQPGGAGGV